MRVAVYGTLKRGFHNHFLLEDSEYLGVDRIKGYSMHSMGYYPAVVTSEDENDLISVEVYEVDAETLAALDTLEGYGGFASKDNMYNRKQIETVYGDTHFYEWADPNFAITEANKVYSGIWVNRVRSFLNVR